MTKNILGLKHSGVKTVLGQVVLTTVNGFTAKPVAGPGRSDPHPWDDRKVWEAAKTFGGARVRLRDTELKFGPFAGLTFDEVRHLQAGDRIVRAYNFKTQREELLNVGREEDVLRIQWEDGQEQGDDCYLTRSLLHAEERLDATGWPYLTITGRERVDYHFTPEDVQTVIASDTEGIRYLDRLLAEDWLYPNTQARLQLFLSNKGVRKQLLDAMSAWKGGPLGSRLMLDVYGSDDFAPNEFSVQETYDASTWRHHRDAAFLRTGNPVPSRDEDPTPAGWVLQDEFRMERGEGEGEDLESDGWQDFTRIADSDVERDWTPPDESLKVVPVVEHQKLRLYAAKDRKGRKPVAAEYDVSPRVWQYALDAITQAEAVGWSKPEEEVVPLEKYAALESHVRPALDAGYDRLGEIIATVKRRLGVAGGKWASLVPAELQSKITEAILAARERLDSHLESVIREEANREEQAKQLTVSRNAWRGLTPTGRKSRKKSKVPA